MEDINNILNFWFGTLDPHGFADNSVKEKWWSGGSDLDAEISHRYGHLVHDAVHHELKDWKYTSQGQLALILLLDQFTRNIYRGTELAYAGDSRALRICKYGLSQKHDLSLPIEYRVFYYMPLEHSEDIDNQALCLRLMESLKRDCPEDKHSMIERYTQFSRQHYDIIKKFGRFPHRNDVLKRANTVEEQTYLDNSPSRFGQ